MLEKTNILMIIKKFRIKHIKTFRNATRNVSQRFATFHNVSQRKVANVFMYEIMNMEQHMHIPDAMKAPESSVSRGVYNTTF